GYLGTRNRAAEALAKIGPEAVPGLLSVLQALPESDSDGREYVGRAFAHLGPAAAPAVEAMLVMRRDHDATCRLTAMVALNKIGASGIPQLIAAARRHEDVFVRGEALSFLAHQKERANDILPTFREALQDPDPSVRLVAKTCIEALIKK